MKTYLLRGEYNRSATVKAESIKQACAMVNFRVWGYEVYPEKTDALNFLPTPGVYESMEPVLIYGPTSEDCIVIPTRQLCFSKAQICVSRDGKPVLLTVDKADIYEREALQNYEQY